MAVLQSALGMAAFSFVMEKYGMMGEPEAQAAGAHSDAAQVTIFVC